MTAFYIARCPLHCSWRSEPRPNEAQALEALRDHVNGHTHADLLTFVVAHVSDLERYERESAPRT